MKPANVLRAPAVAAVDMVAAAVVAAATAEAVVAVAAVAAVVVTAAVAVATTSRDGFDPEHNSNAIHQKCAWARRVNLAKSAVTLRRPRPRLLFCGRRSLF
jgi:hypothetical protein